MIDHPDAQQLLEAMAETLRADVMPACSGPPQHAARVVANLCRILAREWELGPENQGAAIAALAELLDSGGDGSTSATLDDLVARFDDRIAAGDFADDDRVLPALLADAERRLAVDKPGYA